LGKTHEVKGCDNGQTDEDVMRNVRQCDRSAGRGMNKGPSVCVVELQSLQYENSRKNFIVKFEYIHFIGDFMYLHLNSLSYEQLFYIRTCIELKQDPFSGFILPLSNFTYCCIK